jgi:hypothetical protein
MIFHISSAYSALFDTTGGYFWANKWLRTCRVIKVTIPTYICISCWLRAWELILFTTVLDTYCLILRLYTSPENIRVQVKDGCRLLIKIIVFVEHFNVKKILVHGLYNSWKTFSLFYMPITVRLLCHDTAYESCGASSRAPHAYQHPPVKPANRTRCCLSSTKKKKKGGYVANGTNHLRRISLIT